MARYKARYKALRDVEIIICAIPQVGNGAAAPVMPPSFSPVISSIPSIGEQVQKRFESP